MVFAASPQRYATGDKQVIGTAFVDVGIKIPKRLSSFGFKSNDARKRSSQIHYAVGYERRALKRRAARVAAPVADVPSVVAPGQLELRNILAIDLVKRRVFGAAQIAAIVGPLLS